MKAAGIAFACSRTPYRKGILFLAFDPSFWMLAKRKALLYMHFFFVLRNS